MIIKHRQLTIEINKIKMTNEMKRRFKSQIKTKNDINAKLIGWRCIGVRRALIVWGMLGRQRRREEEAGAD